MKRLIPTLIVLFFAVASTAITGAGAAVSKPSTAPTISSISPSSVTRSGRILITGNGFGATQAGSTVSIGGAQALVVRWSDTLIKAYAPESAPLGVDTVQVIVGGTPSNASPLTVQPRQSSGRVRWRVQVEGNYVLHRPAVGPDGGVVVVNSFGDVYSLAADGGLRWVVPFAGDMGPSIGADGTVYVASMNTITAIAPNGSIRWRFTEPSSGQGLIAGPNVGPDGNIYAISDFGGLGAFALSPAGTLLWSNPGSPQFNEYGQLGVEVVFGSGQLYGAFDEVGVAGSTMFGLSLAGAQRWASPIGGTDDMFMQQQRQPATGLDGSLYLTAMGGGNGWGLRRVDPTSGHVLWNYSPWPSNGMSAPDVGPNGSVYFSRSLGYLESVTPAGQSRWVFSDGSIIDHPAVARDGGVVVAGNRPNFGEPGSVRGWNANTGSLLWQVDLPSENSGYQVLYSRSRFSNDSRTVYFGTAILGGSPTEEYSYLYAVDASVPVVRFRPTHCRPGTCRSL